MAEDLMKEHLAVREYEKARDIGSVIVRVGHPKVAPEVALTVAIIESVFPERQQAAEELRRYALGAGTRGVRSSAALALGGAAHNKGWKREALRFYLKAIFLWSPKSDRTVRSAIRGLAGTPPFKPVPGPEKE
ncbi:hypothetical protein [Streptomyces iconiensis]|uniref:Tetratricopeptide repeat protein n=1 Tax=Streptomyces iconiensis TaxID=1384038 RepID=A0ABT6ZZB9_9ACTN|nr:hypothetical protein [Streptomyces iconiensis]MDJ1134154.1 hypothetical protein [Streptomyces iconiensis]